MNPSEIDQRLKALERRTTGIPARFSPGGTPVAGYLVVGVTSPPAAGLGFYTGRLSGSTTDYTFINILEEADGDAFLSDGAGGSNGDRVLIWKVSNEQIESIIGRSLDDGEQPYLCQAPPRGFS